MLLKRLTHLNQLLKTIEFHNHYQTLNVTPAATDEEIKHSFLNLVKKHHPDNRPNSQQYISHQQFIKIKQAYDILKEPNSRKLYDMEMFPETISKKTQNFYFYRQMEFQENHFRRKYQQKRKVNFLINSIILCGLAGFLIQYVDWSQILKPNTLHQIRRQNIILSNQNIDDGPATQQRRRQQYAQQMKDKKIYGNVIQLKVRGAGKESTKAREKRLNGITSIEGVQKDIKPDFSVYEQKDQYM